MKRFSLTNPKNNETYNVRCENSGSGMGYGQRDWTYNIKISKRGKYTASLFIVMYDSNPPSNYDANKPTLELVANTAFKGFIRGIKLAQKKKYKFIKYSQFGSCEQHFDIYDDRIYLNTIQGEHIASLPIKTKVH